MERGANLSYWPRHCASTCLVVPHKFILIFWLDDLVYFVLIGSFPRSYLVVTIFWRLHAYSSPWGMFFALLGLFALDAAECMTLTPVWPRCPLTVRSNVNGMWVADTCSQRMKVHVTLHHAGMTAHLTALPVIQALAQTDETSARTAQAC